MHPDPINSIDEVNRRLADLADSLKTSINAEQLAEASKSLDASMEALRRYQAPPKRPFGEGLLDDEAAQPKSPPIEISRLGYTNVVEKPPTPKPGE